MVNRELWLHAERMRLSRPVEPDPAAVRTRCWFWRLYLGLLVLFFGWVACQLAPMLLGDLRRLLEGAGPW